MQLRIISNNTSSNINESSEGSVYKVFFPDLPADMAKETWLSLSLEEKDELREEKKEFFNRLISHALKQLKQITHA